MYISKFAFLSVAILWSSSSVALNDDDQPTSSSIPLQNEYKPDIDSLIKETYATTHLLSDEAKSLELEIESDETPQDQKASLRTTWRRYLTTISEENQVLGDRLVDDGEYEAALGAYTTAFSFANQGEIPLDGQFYHNLGSLYYRFERFQEAKHYLELARASDKRSKNAHTYVTLSIIYRSERTYKTALKALRQDLKWANPQEKVYIYHEIAMVYSDDNNLISSRDNLLEALQLVEQSDDLQNTPLHANILYDLGTTYIDLKEQEKAIAFLERALATQKLDKNDMAQTHYELGQTRFKQGRRDLTISHYEKALTYLEDGNEFKNFIKGALTIVKESQEEKKKKKKPKKKKEKVIVSVDKSTQASIRTNAMSMITHSQDKSTLTLERLVKELQLQFPQASGDDLKEIIHPLLTVAKNSKRKK